MTDIYMMLNCMPGTISKNHFEGFFLIKMVFRVFEELDMLECQ